MKKKIQTRLLRWFEKNGRDLPWRGTRDPYAIWVSEIMLQQTQVATVIPYYRKFLKSFPTVRHLARADLSEVLRVWEGLGYYSRARNLHRAAQIISNQLHGKIPNTLEGILGLPGIGRSTAGGILSFAYNKDEAILDGNAKRVISRLFAVARDQKRLWEISESLIPKGEANPFNQALMDLGSMICLAKDPQCTRCPLQAYCEAKASGEPEKYPSRMAKKKIPHIEALSAVIQKDGQVLLRQRPPKGLLGGLWEFPNWKVEEKGLIGRPGSLKSWLVRHVREGLGLKVELKEFLGAYEQTYSHFKLTLHVYRGHGRGHGLDGEGAGRWVPFRDLPHFPMSRIHRRIAEVIDREK